MRHVFQSRKFILAICAVIAQTIALAVPEAQGHVETYGLIVFATIGVAILGITFEDSIRLWAARPVTLKEALKEAMNEGLDAVFHPKEQPAPVEAPKEAVSPPRGSLP